MKMVSIKCSADAAMSTNLMIESDEPEWVVKQTKERKRRAMIGQREELEARLEKIRAREKAQRQKYLKGEEVYKKRKFDGNKSSTEQYDEEEFIVDDYESDSEKSKNKDSSGLSAETLALLEKVRPKPKEEELEVPDEIKVSSICVFNFRRH